MSQSTLQAFDSSSDSTYNEVWRIIRGSCKMTRKNNWVQAINYLEEAREDYPDDLELINRLIFVYILSFNPKYNRNNDDKAKELLEYGLKKDPENCDLLEKKAIMERRSGCLEDAKHTFLKIIELRGTPRPRELEQLGDIYKQQDNNAWALGCYGKARDMRVESEKSIIIYERKMIDIEDKIGEYYDEDKHWGPFADFIMSQCEKAGVHLTLKEM